MNTLRALLILGCVAAFTGCAMDEGEPDLTDTSDVAADTDEPVDSIASEIHTVSCGNHTDYLKLVRAFAVDVCFANAGTYYYAPIMLSRVERLCGGNNAGSVHTHSHGWYSFSRNSCRDIPRDYVDEIVIN
jgi:hypothetical protein